MKRGINRQVQAKEAAAQEEKGTANVNVAASLTAYDVRNLIANAIKDMEDFGFLQYESDHPMVQQQNKIETLHPDRLYLDTALSFNQAFADKHLDEVKRVVVALRGKYNAGVSHANEKVWCGDLFNMWLVCNCIADLLSVPQL